MTKFDELCTKLKEIFELDKPELDFGIYRIIHTRAKEINAFLETRLAQKVKAALSGNSDAEKKVLEEQLAVKVQQLKDDGMTQEQIAAVPKVKELKTKLAAIGIDEDAEASVYSHLLDFFSRYYDAGDFVSKRRYKDGVYAIPYSGEEVKLHWANADQYYIKSGESFQNYSFKLDDGARVSFKLVTAETAKDNIKDNDAVRCFVLWNPENAANVEDEERAAGLPKTILENVNGELVIYFQYIKFKKGKKQADLIKDAQEKIAIALGQQQLLAKYNVLALAPTEKEKKRTVLGKHLQQYVAKNTSDYFIHKDLKGFLTRELDFYIKNEMMHLDDVMSADSFTVIEQNLRKIQAVRTIATELIAFMAQLEDFQKKLWLKKKFVTQCDYCITMDRVPEELRAEVLANTAQQEEWKKLGFETNTSSDLFAHDVIDARMVDTKFFPEAFKAKLLRSIPNLAEQCDGVLIHGDNIQALRLINEATQDKIDVIYIDPPYNTGKDGFLYRDGYDHSSWLSMMEGRIVAARMVLAQSGLIAASIGDQENDKLRMIFDKVFDRKNSLANFIWNNEGNIDNQSKVKNCHEYILSYCKDEAAYPAAQVIAPDIPSDSKLFNETIENSITKNGPANPPCEITLPVGFPATFKKNTIKARTTEWPHLLDDAVVENGCVVEPVRAYSGWSSKELLIEFINSGCKPIKDSKGLKTWFKLYHTGAIYCYKTRENSSHVLSVIRQVGTVKKTASYLQSMGLQFDYPKPVDLVKYILKFVNKEKCLVCDFFAGSGTTADAAIKLYREMGLSRKYILVEMGDHFDTVLKPRIEKVVYSPDWKGGKPTASNKGISHCFKYMTLESYEDALNNIELEDKSAGLFEGMKDEYLLKYMLDLESRGSLIKTDDFKHPFDYKLKIAVDSSGASEKRKVDLVETFNYLIGLKVDLCVRAEEKGFAYVDGHNPKGEHVLVFWRDTEKIPNEKLNKELEKLGVNPADKEFDLVYVNGDHGVANVTLDGKDDAKALKIKQIENEFLDKMFEDVK